MSARYELRQSEKLGRYAVASLDLRAGETVLSEQPFVLGPHSDSALVCFGCLLPLVGRFRACAGCGVAPVCAGDGCPEHIAKWHNQAECDLFRSLKVTKGLNPMTMVPNVGALTALRALLKRDSDPEGWAEFMQMETHLDQRRNTGVWVYHQNAVKFIESLGLLEGIKDTDVVQKICAVIDVNSFDVRGPAAPSLGCEPLRGVYMKTALLAHDCVANTHISINDNNLLVCHASTDIKKGEPIYFNYTDPMKGTALRQEHLLNGKYFKCSCVRCCDATEMGTFLSSAICPSCKTGYVSPAGDRWSCNNCQNETDGSAMKLKVQACEDKLGVINKKDEKELEAYIKNVALILAPNHYLLLDAKQRLAGVLRDAIAREPRPTKRLLRRQLELCRELLPVLETLRPGISRIKAITLYEMHAAMVQLAKKLFDSREITGSEYMDELLSAEKHLKRSLQMLFIEPGNSPEGELCAKALEEYRALKATIGTVLDSIHADGKTYVNGKEQQPTLTVQQ
ncbi:SET domain-containing protein SmydA-8-like [Choristoneura fumiferana]|uniref:SET domain-containing protein SmydA-8-like n=1 Tax=Choristoneura fumiferana TaxID=7141 RepID=UPI003D15D1DB